MKVPHLNYKICAALFLLHVITLSAQDIKKETQPVKDVVNLFNNGVILGTENEIFYYNQDGSLRWSSTREVYGNIISSPNGSFVYDINYFETGNAVVVGSGKRKGPQYITRYDSKGTAQKLEISQDKGFGKNLQGFYCDDRYLFSLTTRDGNETIDKKKGTEKLILHRYSNTDFSYKQIALDLPAVSADENSTYWSLMGQSEKGVYLLSKTINLDENKITFTIVTLDDEGKLVETLVLKPTLTNKFFRPAINKEYVMGYKDSRNFLVLQDMESYWDMLATSEAKPQTMTNGIYGHILYDPTNECFFAYGLLGRERKKSEGFYVIKFDKLGKELWKVEEVGSKQLLGESHFVNYPVAARKSIRLTSVKDGKLNVSLAFRDTRYIYEIENGKVIGNERLQGAFVFQNSGNYIFSQIPLKSQQYINSKKLLEERNMQTQQLITPTAEILLVRAKKATEILFFK